MTNALKKIWNIISTVLVVLVVLCAVLLMGFRLVGFNCYTVLTGSMEPAYSPGDLIYVKSVYNKNIGGITDPTEREIARREKVKAVEALVADGTLQVGDPISFTMNETIVATHRIIKIDQENHRIHTKGDANETEDPPVLYENLIGEVYFSVPKLGYVSNYVQNPPGTYVTIGIGIVLVVLVFVPDMIGKKKKEDQKVEIADVQSEMDTVTEENERLKAEVEKLRAEMATNNSDNAE